MAAYEYERDCDGSIDRFLARLLVASDTRSRQPMECSTESSRILLVANRTATEQPLIDAVRRRAQRSPVSFHLVVPATPQGLHRVVDPEDAGREAATARLERALPLLSQAAGRPVTGHVGDANPLAAITDAVHLQGFDEVILSTLPWRVSRWLRLDLPRKVRALGLPVEHVAGLPDRVVAFVGGAGTVGVTAREEFGVAASGR